MSDDEWKHRGPERAPTERSRAEPRASTYPVSRLSAPVSLVDAAREIERADQWIASTSNAKLAQIAAQMRALREQAEQVMEEARANASLHRAEARFARHPGKTYHLYEREGGPRYWSMLSPDDWRGAPPHAFLGSYRLELDQSWTPATQAAEHDRARIPIELWFERGLTTGASAPEEGENECENSSSPPSDRTVPG